MLAVQTTHDEIANIIPNVGPSKDILESSKGLSDSHVATRWWLMEFKQQSLDKMEAFW